MSEKPFNIPADKLPRHIAMIMDGNGRWALSRGLPRLAGHKAGTENLRRVIRSTVEFGVKYLTIYAFSTENWGRPPEEVQGLMYILEDVIDELVSRYLYTAGVPDPDLIIRTSGELRVSNFLIWQAAYSEWYVTPTYWPDFDKEEYRRALETFAQRDRRYGKVTSN